MKQDVDTNSQLRRSHNKNRTFRQPLCAIRGSRIFTPKMAIQQAGILNGIFNHYPYL
jgi:hypothetical protein